MINALKLLKEENRRITYFFPVFTFGYIYIKDYTNICGLDVPITGWYYTGFPGVAYLIAGGLSAITGTLMYRYSYLSRKSAYSISPAAVNKIIDIHAIIEIGSILALLFRLCIEDVFLWTMLFLTIMSWLVNVVGRAT